MTQKRSKKRSNKSMTLLALGGLGLVGFTKWMKRFSFAKVKDNEYVLVTGASAGIGKTTALYLADEVGYHVLAGVRTDSAAKSLLDEAKNKDRLIPIILDVTNEEHIESAVKRMEELETNGNVLKGVFANAGIGGTDVALELFNTKSMKDIMDVNFWGVVLVIKSFLPLLRRSKGRIVISSSVAGLVPVPYFTMYCASKFAIQGMARSLRYELHNFDIKISTLNMGFVQTRMTERREQKYVSELYPDEKMFRESMYSSYSQKLMLTTTKVAKLVEHALRSKHPKEMYLAGPTAPLYLGYKILPQTWMDAILANSLRIMEKFQSKEQKTGKD